MKAQAKALFVATALSFAAGGAQQKPAGQKPIEMDPVIVHGNAGEVDKLIPAGSALAKLRDRYLERSKELTRQDAEDRQPLPVWFRAFLREKLRNLPSKGEHQYPRLSSEIFEWMLTHPTLQASSAGEAEGDGKADAAEVSLSNPAESNRESAIAVDPSNPKFVIAAANNRGGGTNRQRQFHSSDGGVSWKRTLLPMDAKYQLQTDPTVAFTTDGVAWSSAIAIDSTTGQQDVQIFKSTDHGKKWALNATVSSGVGVANDKQMMWVDIHATSPFKDNLYIVWDITGSGIRFARSADKGKTWSAPATLSTDGGIGSHLMTGPGGELYVAWPDPATRAIQVRKSTDGGKTFAAAVKIVTTTKGYEIKIPAMCSRNAFIYVTLAVDRSSCKNKGRVYATWIDRVGGTADPGCAPGGSTSAAHSKVFFSSSSDGGKTWSAAKQIQGAGKNDQFNPWMDVDAHDGTIHVAYYDTKDDAKRRKSRPYHTSSNDAGATWSTPRAIAKNLIDESVPTAGTAQYGDYNGLAALASVVHPVWTHRASPATAKEQIRTAKLGAAAVSAKLCAAVPSGKCPAAEKVTVARFGEFKDNTSSLPASQQALIDALAQRIASGFAPGCKPIKAVDLVGHADKVAKPPQFLLDLSKKRAEQVRAALIKQLGKDAAKVKFTVKGLGATQLQVAKPASAVEHEENRRVVVTTSLGP